MKLLIVSLCGIGFCLCTFCSIAMPLPPDSVVLFLKNESITIRKDTLTVCGNIMVSSNNVQERNIHNEGSILISNGVTPSLIKSNVGNLFYSSTVPFIAYSDSTIHGMGTVNAQRKLNIENAGLIYFNNIELWHDTVGLSQPIFVLGDLSFNGGYLNLNGGKVFLYDSSNLVKQYGGRLIGENDSSHIIDVGFGVVEAMQAVDLKNYDSVSIGNLGFSISTLNKGTVFIQLKRFHFPDSNVTNGSIGRYFLLTTDLKDSLNKIILYKFLASDLNTNDSIHNLRLFFCPDSNGLARYNDLSAKVVNYNASATTINNSGIYSLANYHCNKNPKINFPKDTVHVCSENPIVLNDYFYGSQGDTLFHWSVSPKVHILDSNSRMLKVNANDYKINTSYTFYHTVINPRGCRSFDSVIVKTHPRPFIKLIHSIDSNFLILPKSAYCKDQVVFFKNEVAVNYHFQWLKNFQCIDSSKILKHKLLKDGNTVFSLKITDQYGCFSIADKKIMVHPLPIVNLMVDSIHCLNEMIEFKNLSHMPASTIASSIVSYIWKMNSTPNDSITVDKNGVQAFNVDGWYTTKSISEQNTPSLFFKYNKPSIYPVKLMAKSLFGCAHDTTVLLNIVDSVRCSFDTNHLTNVCKGLRSKFVLNSDCYGLHNCIIVWEFYDNGSIVFDTAYNPTDTMYYIFNTLGFHKVIARAISTQSCEKVCVQYVNIHSSPVVYLTSSLSCIGQETSVLVNGIVNNTINTWFINDDTLYSTNNKGIIYVFPSAGIHKVGLIVYNEFGCKQFLEKDVLVKPIPAIKFNVNNSCVNTQEPANSIINSSLNMSNVKFKWNFGDNTYSTDASPNKLYSHAGMYFIELSAEMDGCYASCIDSIIIFDLPRAEVSINHGNNSICQLEAIELLAQNYSKCNINSVEWLLNDTLFISNKWTELYRTGLFELGENKFSLKLRSEDGCINQYEKEINVNEIPKFSIFADTVCLNEYTHLHIKNESSVPVQNYYWTLGDSSRMLFSSNSKEPTYLYSKPGIYTAVLIIKNNLGCSKSDTALCFVNELPAVYLPKIMGNCDSTLVIDLIKSDYIYKWSTGETAQKISVNNDGLYSAIAIDKNTSCSSVVSTKVVLKDKIYPALGNDTAVCDGIDLNANNDFGDYLWNTGATSQKINIIKSGDYSVTVSKEGCTGSDTVRVVVNNSPLIKISAPSQICAGDSIYLIAKCKHALNIEWLANDGYNDGLISKDSLKIFFPKNIDKSSQFKYTFSATGAGNCNSIASHWLTVNPLPLFDLGADFSLCEGEQKLLSVNVLVSSIHWSTGDTIPEIIINSEKVKIPGAKNHIYASVKNFNSCVFTDSIHFTQYNKPKISLNSEYTICEDDTLYINSNVQDAISYQWAPWTYNSPTIKLTKTNLGGLSTSFIRLSVIDSHHCKASSSWIKLNFLPIPDLNLPTQVHFCNQGFLDVYQPTVINYNWNNGNTSNILKVIKSDLYSLNATLQNGCIAHDSVYATVSYVLTPELGENFALCENETRELKTGIQDSNCSYLWNTNDTGNSIIVHQHGIYHVKVVYNNGCTFYDSITVFRLNLPQVNLGPDFYLCSKENTTLYAGNDGFYYQWGGIGKESTFTKSKMFPVSDTGVYWVNVENIDGCKASDTIRLLPTDLSMNADFISSSELTAADTVVFIDLSVHNPIQWQWNFGDLLTSSLQNPKHVYYGCDTFNVSLDVFNGFCHASTYKPILVSGCEKNYKSQKNTEGTFNFIKIEKALVYPNPAKDFIYILCELNNESNVSVYIYSLYGQQMLSFQELNTSKLNYLVSIAQFPQGMYIVKIMAGLDSKTIKFIKR